MDIQHFNRHINRIYGTFGKPSPSEEVQGAVWEIVQELPNGVMELAVTLLRQEDKLPQNVGGWIKRVAWPAWTERNPQQIDRHADNPTGSCPHCGGKGTYTLYNPQGNYPTAFVCICVPAKDVSPAIPRVTPRQAMLHGFTTAPRGPIPGVEFRKGSDGRYYRNDKPAQQQANKVAV